MCAQGSLLVKKSGLRVLKPVKDKYAATKSIDTEKMINKAQSKRGKDNKTTDDTRGDTRTTVVKKQTEPSKQRETTATDKAELDRVLERQREVQEANLSRVPPEDKVLLLR